MPHIDGTTGQAGGLSGVQISSVLCEDTKRMDFSARAATIPISHQSTTKIQNNEYTTAVRWSASNITDLLRSVLRPNDMPSHYITPIMPLINGYPANDIIQMQKSKPESMSRSQMLTWINRTLNINETRIENLGTGVVYCLLLNHFFPNAISLGKISMIPRSPNDHRSNLRKFQQALSALDIRNISFDVFKVAEMTYAQNWGLICKVHRHCCLLDKEKTPTENKDPKEHWWPKPEIKQELPSFSLACTNILNPMNTPLKGSCQFLQEGKSRWQSMSLIEQIKRIVTGQVMSDRVKVRQLRQLLGLVEEEGQEEAELRDLLSDYKKKEEVILID